MECKVSVVANDGISGGDLIETLWNVKNNVSKITATTTRFNRDIVECKG